MSQSIPAAGGRTAGLAVLFGTLYFIQGIAEPTEGLIAQPVRSLLKSWGHTAGEVAGFMAVLALPWALKPLYGLLTDFLPLGGSRRRSWLMLTTAATATGLWYVYQQPPPDGQKTLLLALLLVPTVGVAFSDVVVDALMVEAGQPRGMTGRLQSVQWAAMYAATILTGFVGGWLSQHGRQDWGFLICAAAAAVSLALAVLFVRERPQPLSAEATTGRARAIWQVVRSRRMLTVAAFLFLWNFNPFSSSVLYMYATKELGLSEQFYGNTISVFAGASIVACVAYGGYCRRVPLKWLIHLAIAAGVAATLAYWGLEGKRSAVWVSTLAGFTYMTGNLIQLDLAARVCPPQVAGTVFASLMALSNFGIIAAGALGGWWFDSLQTAVGPHAAFDWLVSIGAAFTACCWLLAPWLAAGDAGESGRRHN